MDPVEGKRALDWAINNKKDPRSGAVLQKLGLGEDELRALDFAEKNPNDERTPVVMEKIYSRFQNPEPKTGELESTVRGVAQGATMGYADELTGLAGAAKETLFGGKDFSQFGNIYRTERDSSRSNYEKARKDNPKLFTTGEVGGSIATSLIPGLGIAKGAKFIPAVLKAGAIGGIQAGGLSNSDITKGEGTDFVKDVVPGVATGGLMQGAFSGIGAIGRSLKPTTIAKKAGNIMLGAPEDAMERYIKNPDAIKNADSLSDLASKLSDVADDLKTASIQGSKKSREILKESGKTVRSSSIQKILRDKADEITKSFEGVEGSASKVKARDYLLREAEKYGKKDVELSANRIKDLVQDLEDGANWQTSPGVFNEFGNRVAKEMRHSVDQILKGDNKYAEAMKLVAKDTDLVNRLSPLVKNSDITKNTMRAIGRGKKEEAFALMDEIDQHLGTKFVESIQNSLAKEALSKGATNGSRHVNLYKTIGEFFGENFQIIPGNKAIGAMIGATIDKYGPEMATQAIDMAVKIQQIANSKYLSGVNTAIQKLSNFAQKGDPAAAVTFQLLDQARPDLIRSQQNQKQAGLQLPGSR